jgi:aarF domain-containing kinase
MPEWQTEKVLTQDLGSDWKKHFSNFDMKPFAAASIGQVHSATISKDSPLSEKYGHDHDKDKDLKVAVKVQFPGVKESISSDLSNLKWLLLATAVLPRGLYLDNSLKVLERELIDECNYEREAYFGTKMEQFVTTSKLNQNFQVPKVVQELSGKMVLTTEMMFGKPLKSVMNLDQEKRDWVSFPFLSRSTRSMVY